MQLSDLTVVIPVYNCLQHLRQTIACLEKQQPDPALFKVIVVDDGSSDGTGEWLKLYTGRLDLKVISFERNRGRAAARNAGAAEVDTTLILFLDGDMLLPSEFVEGHCKSHNNHNSVVIGRVIYHRDLAYKAYASYLEGRGVFKLTQADPIPPRYFLSGNSSLSRSLWQKAGGFDEQLREYGEDIDFGIRLAEVGGMFNYHPELVVTHLHLRDVDGMVENSYRFGAKAVPYLVNQHPALLQELQLNRLTDESWKGTVIRLLLAEPVYHIVLGVTRTLQRWKVPHLFYTYLTYRSYAYGYKEVHLL